MTAKKESYGIAASDYLRRAQKQASKKDSKSLFYAAFELRCGIEARMHEHLEPQGHVSETKKTEWRIKNLSKTIGKAFGQQDRKQRVTIRTREGREIAVVSYVPVTTTLQKIGEQLGDYLHAQISFDALTSQWWTEFRNMIQEGCNLLEQSVLSQLLGPWLTNQNMHLVAPPNVIDQLKPGVNFVLCAYTL